MKHPWIVRAHRDERGIAIIVVMLVMMVLLSLSLAVVQLSEHSGSAAQLDQRRTQSIHLAESAIDNWLAPLPRTSANHICDLNGETVTATLSPTTEYVLDIELFTSGTPSVGEKVGCYGKDAPDTSALTSARITAEAVAGTATQNSTTSRRFLQQEATLTPIYGPSLSNAIYGGTRVNISNNTSVSEFEEPNDANIYSPGKIGCDYDRWSSSNVSFNSGFQLQGSLVSGAEICGLAGKVYGNTWASDGISINQDLGVGFGGVPFSGFMTTFTGAITRLGGNGNVEYDCTAPVGIAPQFTCANKYQVNPATNCPSRVGAVIIYDTSMCEDPAGIDSGMPQFTWNPSDWTNNPPGGIPEFTVYRPSSTVEATFCADVLAAYKNVAGVLGKTANDDYNWVIDATGHDCQTNITSTGPSPNQILQGNLALVTEGSVNFQQSNTWTTDGNDWQMWIIHTSDEAGMNFPTDCFTPETKTTGSTTTTKLVTTTLDDITISERTDLSGISSVFAYTPCGIIANNNSQINGQFIANTVDYAGQGSLNFAEVALPGVEPVGYKASPLFIREIGA